MNLLAFPPPSIHTEESQLKEITKKRELGAFYTPLSVTEVLCNWAIRSPLDVVLEPSFGGCTFLEASVRRLHDLGEIDARNLFGCDIDPDAFEHLRTRLQSLRLGNFHRGDFLQWTPCEIPGGLVDVVIGNPPYVRYSNLPAEQRANIDLWLESRGESVSRRASLWLFFTLHAMSFLRQGGRIAWVLPTSFMTAHYASGLRKQIFDSFERVAVITLTERIFLEEGTEERTLILLAEGYQITASGTSSVTACLENNDAIKEFVDRWSDDKIKEHEDTLSHGMVPGAAGSLLASLELEAGVVQFGEVAEVQIGVVSGDSKFFIKSADSWQAEEIERRHLRYIVPRSRWLAGLVLEKSDCTQHECAGIPCLAIDPPTIPRAKSLLRYLRKYPRHAIEANATFKKRGKWYRFLDDRQPDAFMVFLTHLGPRLVVNAVKANCTNSLHRVYLRAGRKRYAKLLAISLQTTFTQLAAERLGRGLGSGALKLDPNEIKRLPVLLPRRDGAQVREAFSRIDSLLRSGKSDAARIAADTFIFSDNQHFMRVLPLLEESLHITRRRRMRSHEDKEDARGSERD
ncbi:HsdM family class I SAM-dependent methyltransferase [Pseudoxanthomonas mexicana]|uniref:HsdM family class I SAM-dependent methyltransferase n=1 Tax=Pseudoxanthomonas mexicana TaxID=128785 RepID=UPI00209F8AE2|nr:N-6 DNA methylase [Pseudoxanthomonas mexicana]MCP1582848.1 hypothetical protein [Pseudoxanthomonas mexicana]